MALREGTEVLRGEGDHVRGLAQQQEEQEVRDERLGLGVLPQIAAVAETELLLAGTEPERDPGPRAPGAPLRRALGSKKGLPTVQVCLSSRHKEASVMVEFMLRGE